jgi:hypothetical protein
MSNSTTSDLPDMSDACVSTNKCWTKPILVLFTLIITNFHIICLFFSLCFLVYYLIKPVLGEANED